MVALLVFTLYLEIWYVMFHRGLETKSRSDNKSLREWIGFKLRQYRSWILNFFNR
jgi:hypothetical protein